MPKGLRRYDLFGWDYAGHCPLSEREVAWYRRFAATADGPVLELACGTGRLACRLAEAGCEVVGMDLSEAMLARARADLAGLPANVRSRVELVRGDMTNFDLHRTFPLIYIADNSIRELDTLAEYHAFLRCVARHLDPGGVFLSTVRRFDPSRFAGGVCEYDWSEPVCNPETGESVSRRIILKLVDDGRMLSGNMIYRSVAADRAERVDECPFTVPVMLTDDYVEVFREAGLGVEVHVGYDMTVDDGKDPILCFVCRKGHVR